MGTKFANFLADLAPKIDYGLVLVLTNKSRVQLYHYYFSSECLLSKVLPKGEKLMR